jgi:purine nucleoside phosphorylase
MKFASQFVKESIGDAEVAIVLGSGLGDLINILSD